MSAGPMISLHEQDSGSFAARALPQSDIINSPFHREAHHGARVIQASHVARVFWVGVVDACGCEAWGKWKQDGREAIDCCTSVNTFTRYESHVTAYNT